MLTPLRMAQLLAIALAGGFVLGALAGSAFFAPVGFVLGGAFGLVIGFISLAVIAPALANKNLVAGVALVYPLPVLVAIGGGALGPDAAIPAAGAALALSALVTHCILPNSWPARKPGQCRACGYDLAGISDRCPECGVRVTPTRKERRWRPISVAWLALVSIGLLTLSATTVPPALERATLGYATHDPQRLMRLMGDRDMQTSYNAAERLKHINPDLLIEALDNPDHNVRRQAAYSMRRGYEHDPHAVQALIRTLNDADAHVRYEAAVTLGSIADPAALDSLRRAAATDPSAMVVRAAEGAVAEIEARHQTAPPPGR